MGALKYRMIIQYDGTAYHGWQFQRHDTTVQGTIEEKMKMILGRTVRLTGASRTDTGVHADHQVAHFLFPHPLEHRRILRALNAVLPWDIRIRYIERVPHKFHARFSSDWKEYIYRVYTADVLPPPLHRYVWHLPRSLNYAAMVRATRDLVGTHNYAPFGKGVKPGEVALRTVMWARWENHHPLYVFHIASRGFLRGMVRYIVGTLVDIGMGRKPVNAIQTILGEQDREAIQLKAPARGLCLKYIHYPDDVLFTDNRP